MFFTLLMWLVFIVSLAVLAAMIWSSVLGARYPENPRSDEIFFITTVDLWRIRLCRFRKPGSHGEPVLLVHGLNANSNNFTRPAGGCLVDYLSARGYDCWTIDVRGTSSSQAPSGRSINQVTVEDLMDYDLNTAIAYILETTGYSKLHWVGHSLGGFLLYAYVLGHGADKIASGVTLGSPTKFDTAFGHVPAWLLQFGMRMPRVAGECLRCMVPLARAWKVGTQAFPINQANIHPSMDTGDLYRMLENPAPRVHEQLLEWSRNGEVVLRNGSLNITQGYKTMRFPLLAIFGAEDPFVQADDALSFFNAIQHDDKKLMVCSKAEGFVEDYNHCDLAFSREGGREVFAPITVWITTHPVTSAKPAVSEKSTGLPNVPAATEPTASSGENEPRIASVTIADEKPVPAKRATAPKKSVARKADVAVAAPVAPVVEERTVVVETPVVEPASVVAENPETPLKKAPAKKKVAAKAKPGAAARKTAGDAAPSKPASRVKKSAG